MEILYVSGVLPIKHDLAKFSNSQRKNKSLGRAERSPNSYFFVKLARSCIKNSGAIYAVEY